MSIETIIDSWRKATTTEPELMSSFEGHAPKVVALMSCPRLGWTDTFGCVHDVLQPLGIKVVRHSGVFWGQSLTRLFEESVKRGIEFILTVDYDSIFTRQHVIELVRLIVENEDVDAIVPVQVRRESNHSMFTIMQDDKLIDQCNWEEFNKPLTKIATGHFGLTIIRSSSLAKLEKPWFKAYPDLNGSWRQGHIDEDIGFWINSMAAGWNTCLANGVRIGHLQNVIAWPKPDFTPRFQYISGWLTEGQPKEEAWQS